MTRKDTILIAVVINAGLLAILFATAIIYDTDKVLEQPELNASLVDAKRESDPVPVLIAAGPAMDEVDNVLKYYTSPSAQPIHLESQMELYANEPIAVQANAPDEDELPSDLVAVPQLENFVEVTVKKGDMLEKIAKANGTTVNAIKKANQLQSERLFIGQVLKIPAKQEKNLIAFNTSNQSLTPKKTKEKKDEVSAEAVYYVVKSGDNPWKIAKQFNVKFDDILRLNQLDEERAKNLKIGDRIRVK